MDNAVDLPEDGAAAKAGVRVGDLIVGLDADRIANRDQLQKLYQKNAKDAELVGQLQILRNAKIEIMQVTFGQWEE